MSRKMLFSINYNGKQKNSHIDYVRVVFMVKTASYASTSSVASITT